jgi:Response regulators consisting of a CheY-like receiver domain and a winged-helix DNA-binding domain
MGSASDKTSVVNTKIEIRHILYVEDDCDDQTILQEVLAELRPNIKVDCTNDGNKLLDLLTKQQPDLLLLDLVMPIKNGLECLVEIRKKREFERLPIVVYSAATNPRDIQVAYEMGANLFLIKSNSYRGLSASLAAVLDLNWNDPEAVKSQYFINGRYVAFA